MQEAIDEFLEYTSSFFTLLNDSYDIYNINLKINHTFRVMDLCGEIAESLNLTKEDITLAKLCGLLHDIGRFEQWNRYKTFVDSKSVDHGDFGAKLLKEKNFIRRFNNDEKIDDLIIKGVKNHNKYEVEDEFTEREKLFTNIVRDADKTDILYLYTINDISIDVGVDSFSDSVLDCLKNHKLIDRRLKKTKADTLSVSLAFVFDINYKKTFEILRDRSYLDKEIDIYINKTTNQKLKEQLKESRSIINNYIDRRCL